MHDIKTKYCLSIRYVPYDMNAHVITCIRYIVIITFLELLFFNYGNYKAKGDIIVLVYSLKTIEIKS